mgnify:CR=1 FL=1
MKKLLLLSLLLLMLQACYYEDWYYDPPSAYKPVLMEREVLENSIKLLPPQPIENYGKIYTKDKLLYINEFQRGVHIIDNSNPSSPKALAFISIPGNVDISIKNNIIYADNATDLVALKYDGANLSEVDRNRNVFPEPGPPDGLRVEDIYSKQNRPENTIIIKWEKR